MDQALDRPNESTNFVREVLRTQGRSITKGSPIFENPMIPVYRNLISAVTSYRRGNNSHLPIPFRVLFHSQTSLGTIQVEILVELF